MSKKKLIRKMAIPAAAIFGVSIVGLLLQNPVESRLYQKRVALLNAHIAVLVQANQEHLTEIAGKIAALETGEVGASRVVAEQQSELLRENQQVNRVKKYLWMSGQHGEFIFGVPAHVFVKLNAGFDKNKEIIGEDGNYKDRNDFLMRLLDKHDQLDFSVRKSSDQQWRFYQEPNEEYDYSRPRTFVFSAPVTDEDGTVKGTLFLKVDDSVNHELYSSRYRVVHSGIYDDFLEPLFATFAFLSGLFLWFLLPSWVYIDAQQRAVSNPGVWAFISLISLIFGLAIYLITRPSTTKSLHCPKCENQLNGAGMFCPHCGFDISSTYCPQCQYPIKPEWSFCPNCRAGLAQRKTLEKSPEQLKEPESSPQKD